MDRFWNPGDVPEQVKDWVSENVVQAIDGAIGETDLLLRVRDGKLFVMVASIEKSDGEIWKKEFDFQKEIEFWANDYALIENISDAQRDDLVERAKALDLLATRFREIAGI